MKSITLCADDYGQNTAISQAILALLQEKRLSATSCMTNTPFWSTQAAWLKPLKEQADIGLHINLTQGYALSSAWIAREGTSFPSLFTLLKKSYLRQLDKTAVLGELHAQLDQFIRELGRMPDFIDGHQHVHQLPVIRDTLLTFYHERLRPHACYVRCLDNSKTWLQIKEEAYIKRVIIQLCGANTFKQQLVKNKIPHNASFSGIYNFAHASCYSKLFPSFLQQSRAGGLIMCHPGLENSHTTDEIAKSRVKEYEYFQSEEFLEACQIHQVAIGRFVNIYPIAS
ncbi:MAG: Carbohydrate deacetylase [Gammaproteobacteria bacterium]|jgi:predicted glycoside hydrolase/deacetylase ChbG (UPF0249 family)|nr:Carbohydrate deacetylase [Gammaproteobacteria bacterium]